MPSPNSKPSPIWLRFWDRYSRINPPKFPYNSMAIAPPYFFGNSAIASSASTPPVIEIGANGALAATSAAVSMI